MTSLELLDHLAALRVHVWSDGDRLRVRAPRGVITPELRATLEAHKPDLLARLRSLASEGLPPIARIARTGRLPLSSAQQRLWFLAELEPESAAYNIPAAVRITGTLDRVILERAVNEIVRRHEVLRTTFRNVRGEPVLEIHDDMPIAVAAVDLSDRPADEQMHEVQRLAAEQTRALFDLATGPLMRFSLVRLGPTDQVLLFTVHHLASDGWSSRVLMHEAAMLYGAFSRGRPSPLPDLPLQYVDYAAWQRQWLQGERLDRQVAYWREKLDALPLVELPTDRPRPPVQTFDGASLQFTLPRALGDGLKRLAREEGGTLFQLLLSAFAVLLHHVTGAEHLPIGSPVVNRGRRELEALVGFFVNTVILRVDVSGRPTFRDLLRRVRDLTLDAYAHQDLPFEHLVAQLQPQRDLARNALFQVVFVVQDNPVERQDVAGLTLRQLDVGSCHVKFELVVNIWDSQDGLVVWWEYNSGLFERSTIATLFERYERLLTAIEAAPSTPIDALEVLSPEELSLLAADSSVPALREEFAFAS